MVSDSSDYLSASSLLDVVGVVAEWLSLAERLNLPSVSHIVLFLFKVEIARYVGDNSRVRYCYEARYSAVVLLEVCCS